MCHAIVYIYAAVDDDDHDVLCMYIKKLCTLKYILWNSVSTSTPSF